jgi:hypothetical protein
LSCRYMRPAPLTDQRTDLNTTSLYGNKNNNADRRKTVNEVSPMYLLRY